MTSTAVLLIPGFFGFGRFGRAPDTQLDYFAEVVPILQAAQPEFRIYVHEPPPTGSLSERVASLHDAVSDLVAGRPIRHHPEVTAARRVHLVGHSTGGVDAWLYTSPEFRWIGGPLPEQRSALLERIGSVVTLSAPFRGTPIAKFARGERDVFLMAVYALTVLGSAKVTAKFSQLAVAALVRRLLGGTNPGDQLSTLSGSLEQLRAPHGNTFVDELLEFFTAIVEDRQLLRDLTLEAMAPVYERVASKPHPIPVKSYVSLAPRPSAFFSAAGIAALFADLGALPEQALYAHLYSDTAGEPPVGPRPASARIFGDNVAAHLAYERANDGVVPAVSQTLDGRAEAIVLGDHLDVTGHYEGAAQRNVFKSSAEFKASRLTELWTHIAKNLT